MCTFVYVYVALHLCALNNIVSLMALCEDGENDPGQMTHVKEDTIKAVVFEVVIDRVLWNIFLLSASHSHFWNIYTFCLCDQLLLTTSLDGRDSGP